MRYGIFSDVHSNLQALSAVMEAYSRENIDRYYCLGDIVGYGADPSRCIALVKQLPLISLAGNHDWAAAGVIDYDNFNIEAQEAVIWTRKQLDSEESLYLKGLALVLKDKVFTLVHGTLADPGAFEYMFDEGAAAETFVVMDTRLCFVGHTHHAGTFIRDGDNRISYERAGDLALEAHYNYIINAGSVGQPRDGDPRAVYCVYDSLENRVQIKRITYDVQSARARIISSGLPGYLGDRLLSGR